MNVESGQPNNQEELVGAESQEPEMQPEELATAVVDAESSLVDRIKSIAQETGLVQKLQEVFPSLDSDVLERGSTVYEYISQLKAAENDEIMERNARRGASSSGGGSAAFAGRGMAVAEMYRSTDFVAQLRKAVEAKTSQFTQEDLDAYDLLVEAMADISTAEREIRRAEQNSEPTKLEDIMSRYFSSRGEIGQGRAILPVEEGEIGVERPSIAWEGTAEKATSVAGYLPKHMYKIEDGDASVVRVDTSHSKVANEENTSRHVFTPENQARAKELIHALSLKAELREAEARRLKEVQAANERIAAIDAKYSQAA